MSREVPIDFLPYPSALLDEFHRILDANRSFVDLMGQAQIPFGAPIGAFTHPGHRSIDDEMWQAVAEGSSPIADKRLLIDGRGKVWVRQSIGCLPALADGRQRYMTQFVDMTKTRALKGSLIARATRDSLTKTYVRIEFLDRLRNRIVRMDHDPHPFCVLFIDIDEFKEVNDQHGHQVGDLVLKTVATAIRRCLDRPDVLARYAGDEFVVLREVCPDRQYAMDWAHCVRQAVEAESLVVSGECIEVSVSVGAAWVTPDGSNISPEEVIRKADQALYVAKRRGRNAVHLGA